MGLLQEIKVPLIAVNDTSLTVVEISHANGDHVQKGTTVMVFETSKTTYNVEAEVDGFINYLCEVGSDYEVNDIVARIFSGKEEADTATIPPAELQPPAVHHQNGQTIAAAWTGITIFSNGAKKLMEESKLNTEAFAGRDFVNLTDVESLLGIRKTPAAPKTAAAKQVSAKEQELPVPANSTKVKLTGSKKREIEYLGKVQSTGLTSTINTHVETDGIFIHINNALAVLKNSLLPVIVYETSRLLKIYPLLNGYFSGDSIILYNDVNIGFAIDIDKGLKVLNVRNADTKQLSIIENEIVDLSTKYLDDKLAVEELTEISFTITDLSGEDVSFFRPLVNMQNSAILGVSSIDQKLQRLYLSMSFDHRVTEGKLVAQFLKDLKNRLESYRGNGGKTLTSTITCFKCAKRLSEDLSDTGFAKVLTPSGEEAYICQSCFKGF
ncbi:2-oxo acid dehydrogenase subunit E2 [Pollutibacter soli]|uniref:2-oxo acid dehydrogenase subunit E2 n=1 Tax=Pollutibacter soli TaxID=3034157 RepID=UPI003013AF31